MPIYEFQCEKCGSDFEQLFRTMEAQPRVACPKCGAKKVRRKLSVFGMSGSRKDGSARSGGSGCGSCRARSCAGCHR